MVILTKNVLARAHKKFQHGQHSEIYLITLKEQDKTKMELPLDMVSLSASSCRTIIISRGNLILGLYCTFRPDKYIPACGTRSNFLWASANTFFFNFPIKLYYCQKGEILGQKSLTSSDRY